MNDFDAIVIGSGAGGLTAAVALARAGKKVIVFEQHYLPGGWCHSFTLEGYQFSPGVHYIGALHPGGTMRAIYEGLEVADDLTFLELNPDGFDHVQIGGERFDIPAGKERYAERLKARFPKDAKGIDAYLDIVDVLHGQLM
ncbi:MAG: NAD(P)/FAD-dependent oxidoreductase, partial [Deltaproteobacteria bacterium]|nr:NAD(P)/FAD-dependent oxidoreductase [Deltaproteobacteria bacterium]